MKMRSGWLSVILGVVMLSTSSVAVADVPDRSSGRFGGLYKVASSTDPIFPATRTCEYFLDFGRGIRADKASGSVAVSVRRSPNVQVRLMAWQYLPEQGVMVMGNPFGEGSRKAVARGTWRMKGISNGIVFERGSYQIILRRADPDDY